MKRYDPQEVEPNWQRVWEETKLFAAAAAPAEPAYVLDMFPYPSGDGLHVGHPRGYSGSDAYAHFRRFHGQQVLHPIGWDAFGLPAENAAIKKGVHPAQNTARNIENFRRQLKSLGFSYDWDREVNTSDPAYYRWTQWIFLELYKKGLAYRDSGWQWWCPKDKTVLANEQVVDGKCERCDTAVTKKELTQWFLKITEYADELVDALDGLDWPDQIKTMQRNWIGRSYGAEVTFATEAGHLTVYTTRPDTLYGATYMVLAPEHELVGKLTTTGQAKEVAAYVEQAKTASEIERTTDTKEKTGVFTGAYATNPANGERIPIWIADYVLASYGTGAIMAVPAHDARDHAFATKFKLPITEVVQAPKGAEKPYTGEGPLINSGGYTDQPSDRAREQIVADLARRQKARAKTGYKLRDWLISRQRYWGTPIPIIHCPKCGEQAVPEKDLPVELPDVEDYLPTGDGRSPLAKVDSFVKTKCPKCNGSAERETDTMDTFADSSWYFLRYPTPNLEKAAFDTKAVEAWLPVDRYVGGAEHAVLHLLYARFWTKALADAGHFKVREPFASLRNQGLIHAEDGRKMSKSLGNVVNPDEIVEAMGADTLRLYELFIGPFDQAADWSTQGIEGVYRFAGRVWRFGQALAERSREKSDTAPPTEEIGQTAGAVALNQGIRQVTRSLEGFRFNTAVSGLMETLNEFYKAEPGLAFEDAAGWRELFGAYLVLLAPFAPHLAEELWHELGHDASIFTQRWPQVDERVSGPGLVSIVVQVNGKVRTTLEFAEGDDVSEAAVTTAALADENVKKFVERPKKAVYVEGKLLNLVA